MNELVPPPRAGSRAGRTDERRGPGEPGLEVVLAQLPARLSRALGLFHDLTGFSAVTSLGAAVEGARGPGAIAPPVHPRCASVLRTTASPAPCADEWRRHVRMGLRSRSVQRHVCSLGLRCSCVPIYYGTTLVGIAKFVAGPRTTDRGVSLAARALELVVSHVCQDSFVTALSDELSGLRRQVAELRKVRTGAGAEAIDGHLPRDAPPENAPAVRAGSRVEEVLEYVRRHYLDPTLSLASVGRALELNERYVTHLFTQVVGQRMHAYVVHLRLQHACRQLLSTRMPIKEIAYESGFRRPDRFRRAFREKVGVAPSTYRRIFAEA